MAKQRCKLKGCEREHHAKGYCNRHYHKLRLYGDPVAGRFDDSRPAYERKSEAGIKRDRSNRKLKAAPDLVKKHNGAAPQPEKEWIPEPKHERQPAGSQSNLSFFLNQRFIEKLYNEVLKAEREPLYKSSNYVLINDMLSLAARLAGYNSDNPVVWEEFSAELLQWAEKRDKIRFMETLANWPQRVKQYTPKKPIQLSFDSMFPNKVRSR